MPLVNAGRDFITSAITNNGSPVFFTNANAFLGVGNGTAVVAATQTNLQGASRARKAMDATYPLTSGNQITWRATFGLADANFDWEEHAAFNNGVDGSGTMLYRKVESYGPKGSNATWQLTITQTIIL